VIALVSAKRLVIDAIRGYIYWRARTERRYVPDLLRTMLEETSHRLVMTKEIGEEWDNHSHRYARIWRRSMNAKRRVDRPRIPHDSAL